MKTLYIDSKKVSALYIDGKKVKLEAAQVQKYLTIEPLSSDQLSNDTYVVINHTASKSLTGTFEAKLNDNDWTTISWEDVSHGIDYNLVKACDTSKEYLEEGDKLQLRNIDKWSSAWNDNVSLKITNQNSGAKVYGKMADSLTPEYAASTASYKLASFFKGSTGLKDASGLDLDGIVVATYCYQYMFSDCSNLTQAPALLATTLAEGCYSSMFYGCSSLTQAPALPATELTLYCYGGMFDGCSSLTQAPALPATTLYSGCYQNMFRGCSSLTQAPVLPATELADSCYLYMFIGCTKVTELHYPASVQNDITFTEMEGTPWFGATNATVHYDL